MEKKRRIKGRALMMLGLIIPVSAVAFGALPAGAAPPGPSVKVGCDVGASTAAYWKRVEDVNYVEIYWYDGEYLTGTFIGQATGTVKGNRFSAPTPAGASATTQAFAHMYFTHQLGSDLVGAGSGYCLT